MLNKKETRVVTELSKLLSMTAALNEQVTDFINPNSPVQEQKVREIQESLEVLHDTVLRTNNAVSDLLVPYK